MHFLHTLYIYIYLELLRYNYAYFAYGAYNAYFANIAHSTDIVIRKLPSYGRMSRGSLFSVSSSCHHHVILMSFAGGSTRGVWREKREMRWCELWRCKMYTDARCADVRCFGPPISSSACGVQGFVKGCHRTFAGQGAAEVWRCLRSLLAPPFGRGQMQIQHRFRLSWPYGLASPSLFTHVF